MKAFFCAACAAILLGCGTRTTDVKLALQPPSTNNYPSHFAQWLGFYEQEGVHVGISQVAGASKVLEALVGGSADVAGGVYEQAIQMAADGRRIVSFVSLLRSPNFALVASYGRRVRSLADLRGKMVGVSAVGSPSQFYLNHLLMAAGIKPLEVSTASIGMGATAMVALERGQVDAAILFGSAITTFVARRPDAVILADARTRDGLRAAFGVDDYPASCLLASEEWLQANPETARRMSRAVLRALAWIREHTAEEVLAKVPPEFRAGDPAAEIAAIRMAQPMYSIHGRISPEAADAVRRVLEGSLESVRKAQVDLSKTYTNRFLP